MLKLLGGLVAVVVRNYIPHRSAWPIWLSIQELFFREIDWILFNFLLEPGKASFEAFPECTLGPGSSCMLDKSDFVGLLEILLVSGMLGDFVTRPDGGYYSKRNIKIWWWDKVDCYLHLPTPSVSLVPGRP